MPLAMSASERRRPRVTGALSSFVVCFCLSSFSDFVMPSFVGCFWGPFEGGGGRTREKSR